jgi:hypothetical protein
VIIRVESADPLTLLGEVRGSSLEPWNKEGNSKFLAWNHGIKKVILVLAWNHGLKKVILKS